LFKSGSGGHAGEVLACTFTPDNAFVLSAGWDGHLRLWDAHQATQVSALQVGKKPVSACAVARDGKQWLSGSSEGLLGYWDVLTMQPRLVFLAHPRPISAIALASDGRTVATASWDCNVILWQFGREREGRTLSGHADSVNGCRFTPDGQTLVSWSNDTSVRLWEVPRARLIGQLTGHTDQVKAGAVSPDGRWAATGANDGVLNLWDLAGRRQAATLKLGQELRGCWFLLDAQALIVADARGQVTLHAVPGLEQRGELALHLPVQCGELSASGAQLALGSAEGHIHLVSIDGFDSSPLVVQARESSRRSQTMLQRLFGKSQLTYVYTSACPVCHEALELPAADPAHPVACPNCRRQLRIAVVTRAAPGS
jgi:WD40 repeat protein